MPPGGSLPGGSRRWDRPGCGLLILWVAVAWGLELADALPFLQLDHLGIRPRRLVGLPGILLAPWLHLGFGHLIANTMAFLGLGAVVLLADGRRFITTTMILVLVSGLGVWLIGRPNTVHIGASSLIYGYFGYVMARAIWEKKVGWAILGILVGVFYGGMIWGVLPSNGPIPVSWEGHLSGLLAGLWLGWTHVKDDEASAGKGLV